MFRSLLFRRAVRHYAARLPEALRQGYGASEFYTAAQIEAAVRKAQLPPEHIALGYAAFLSEDAFRQVGVEGDYQALRTLFHRYIRTAPAYGVEPLDRDPGTLGGIS